MIQRACMTIVLFRNGRSPELAKEPGLCRLTVPHYCRRRDVQHISRLFDAESTKNLNSTTWPKRASNVANPLNASLRATRSPSLASGNSPTSSIARRAAPPPRWHVLEGQFTLVLANAMHIRNVPGPKGDVNDATWIADLLAHGLIRSSFVPVVSKNSLWRLGPLDYAAR
jgi:hypothetical protein